MEAIFIQQKNELLKSLEEQSNKLLFPNTLIRSLNVSGLKTFGNFLKKYNEYIKKIRVLNNKLKILSSWGIFYNSHYLWKVSVSSNIESLKIYIDEIINYANGKNVDMIKKMILTQNNVNSSDILIFMIIKKKGNKYIYNFIEKKTNNVIIIKELSIDYIKNLLPRCIIFNGVGGKTLKDMYENIHELDESDIIFIDSKNII